MLRDGTKFTKQFSKIKYDALIKAGDEQVADFAKIFSTVERRFTNSF